MTNEPRTPSPSTDTDTPTGTDPDAKYETPGYEDKSLGQAVAQDRELADRLVEEHDDIDDAEAAFDEQSTGAPARRRQEEGGGGR